MARWEVEDEDWAEIRDQLCAKLVEVARSRDLISYGKLVRVSPSWKAPSRMLFTRCSER